MNWYKLAKRKYRGQHYGSTAFFTDGEKVLLLKRNGNSFPDMWCLPGGHAEDGETDRDTVERETVEEIGTIQGYHYADHAHNGWVTFFYRIDEPFDVKLNDEHSDYEWVDLDKFESYDLVPYLKKAARKYYWMAKK